MRRNRRCGDCEYWELGTCFRNPTKRKKKEDEWCGDFKRIPASREILETDLALLGISVYTRNVLAHLKIHVVEDLLLRGRFGIVRNGLVDQRVIKEVEVVLEKLGISWDSV